MKQFMLLTVLVLFTCCKEKEDNVDTATIEEKSEAGIVEEVPSDTKTALLPTYNFDGLSERYFEASNDTLYVMNFWATWCKPCVKELPAFEQLRENYSDKKVKVVLASLDFPDKVESQVIPFIKNKNLQSEVVLLDDPDGNTWIPKVSSDWSGAIPATIFLQNGERKFFEQSFTYESLEKEVVTFINQQS
ncbi:TlpA family protein disulfide reductase [Flavobacteriaceae bacterium TK19130]|nr:TlpA family protein disulfide reductase [Thermobacterium salinum]